MAGYEVSNRAYRERREAPIDKVRGHPPEDQSSGALRWYRVYPVEHHEYLYTHRGCIQRPRTDGDAEISTKRAQ